MIIMIRIVALKANQMIYFNACSIKGLLTILGDQPFFLKRIVRGLEGDKL
jgi:hypothetical protein